MKQCTKCGETKPLTEFHAHKWGDGRRPDCKACRQEYGRRRQSARSRDLSLRKYGITESDWQEIAEIQGGGCAICGEAPPEGARPLCVDHDHETGSLRGLLCPTCNGGLGMFKDDPSLLVAAAQYLKFWSDGWAAAQSTIEQIQGQQQFWQEVQDGYLRPAAQVSGAFVRHESPYACATQRDENRAAWHEHDCGEVGGGWPHPASAHADGPSTPTGW